MDRTTYSDPLHLLSSRRLHEHSHNLPMAFYTPGIVASRYVSTSAFALRALYRHIKSGTEKRFSVL